MFLKRIDIIGFKSFADKTSIDFSPGITAVVGPNGSGKSNIADAIRWVLGEQSARNLRGSKMEDVIFAGSESRRSTNYCEVSLTLDNSDGHLPVPFNEVVVTRRVFRSGESEYLINKQPCRLKDITELFMDSGMGRESYSIIGQGRIEEMLSTRPEDRRGPFEDAAGIVKYKFRRREAERKLEETAANIVRVDDILSELERQAGPLEKEAERARLYKQYEEELTALDISLLVHEIEQLQARWREMGATVEQFVQRRQQVANELAQMDARLQEAKAQFEAKSAETDAVQRKLLEAVESRQRAEGQLDVLRERLRSAEQSASDRDRQRKQVTEEQETIAQQYQALAERRSQVQAELEVRSAELEAAVHAVDPAERQRLEAEIEQLNADLIEMHHQAAALRNELKMSEESLGQDDRRKARLAEEEARWTNEIRMHQQALRDLADERGKAQAALEQAQAELEQASATLHEKAQEEAAVVTQIHQAQSRAASLQSRHDLLKELEEGYDGYALGARTVLQQADKGRLKGVHGPLAALIQVRKEYETAIETALAGALQNIVVGTEADARAAIELLKQRQAGRATFMPLSVIRGRSLAAADLEKVSGMAGLVGVASDLVECQPQYVEVVRHLLGNVLVTEKLIHANEIARKLDYRVRIVTLEGDVVSPGGVMSGGSHARKGPGLLGRSREKAEVERQIQETAELIVRLRGKQESLRSEMTDIQERQRSLLATIDRLKQSLAALETRIREVQANEQNAQDRLESVRWEAEQLTAGQQAWQERLNQAREQLASTESQLAHIEAALAATRAELQRRDEAVKAAQESLTALKVQVATLKQEADVLGAQLAELDERRRRLAQRDAQLYAEWQDFVANRASLVEEIAATEKLLADLRNEVQDLEARLAAVKQERQILEGKVAEAEKAYREKQREVTAADEQLHRAEVLAERTDLELNHALQRMGENFHMTYEWAKEHYPPVTDPEETKRAADSLRRKIVALGEVQLGAIDEWNRLSDRIQFLQRERTDLEEARAQLEIVIQEIDEEMSRRFAQTFESIRTEFQVSFRQLFGGGRADLTLTDPDQLLTTGIEVVAQPPGKKLQNLNLLSGGERALTAMALLFAILKVRPVPFCVLDEVEAALDEANVGRFAQQLRRFSAETQFIVITHRRGTMEEADVLYGVTMQESGVSSLIGVRLADVDADTDTA
jgi:chromosome segregation protein